MQKNRTFKTFIIFVAIVVLGGLIARAASFTYTWVPRAQPPAAHNYPRLKAIGQFTVDAECVASGTIQAADAHASPYAYVFFVPGTSWLYRSFDNGTLNVDPETGEILTGALHASAPWSSYGYAAWFYPTAVLGENPLERLYGVWTVTFNP